MLHEMKTQNCQACSMRADCHDLDAATRATSEFGKAPAFTSPSSAAGPLTLRREHARKTRLIRPSGR